MPYCERQNLVLQCLHMQTRQWSDQLSGHSDLLLTQVRNSAPFHGVRPRNQLEKVNPQFQPSITSLHFCFSVFSSFLPSFLFSSIYRRPDYCSECFYNNELKLILLYLYVVISTLFTFTCTSMFMTQHVSFSLQVSFMPVFSSSLTISARCRE